jgi:magnesium-transporting ATPase (P-type)
MLEAQEKEAINKGMLTLWVIWGAMLGSLFIYIVVCYVLGEGFVSAEESNLPIGLLRKILAVIGVVVALVAYFMRRSILSGKNRIPQPKPVERTAEWNTIPFVAKYVAAVIVSLAMSESIGIYGFVLFLLGDSFQTLYTFMVVSALAMVFYRPKREELERLAMAYKKRDGSTPAM